MSYLRKSILEVFNIFRMFIQFGIASILMLFSTAVSWYEGSAILDNPWEWRYSTPFTQLLYGEVSKPSDISQLDYFVYAAKFQPTFPIIMIISALYLLVLVGYLLLKREDNLLDIYISLLGICLLLLSYFVFNSPTFGGQIFFFIFLTSGILCSAFVLKRIINLKLMKNQN